jgi:hypothetical protein
MLSEEDFIIGIKKKPPQKIKANKKYLEMN